MKIAETKALVIVEVSWSEMDRLEELVYSSNTALGCFVDTDTYLEFVGKKEPIIESALFELSEKDIPVNMIQFQSV